MIAKSSIFKGRLMVRRAIRRRTTATVAVAIRTAAITIKVGPLLSLRCNDRYCSSANEGLLDPRSLFFMS